MRSSFKLMIAIGLAACASPDPTSSDLNISNRVPGTIEGTFQTADNVIAFSSVAVDQVVTTKFDFGDVAITYVNDHGAGTGSVTATGSLSASQHEAAIAFVGALSKQFAQDVQSEEDLPLAEFMLDRMSSHVAVAPINEALPTVTFVSQRDVRYLPCGRGPNYLYQAYTGQWWYAWTGQGGNCEGRCGIGCGPDNLYWFRWGSGVYSQDCALHDYGLQAWGYAIDDYAASSNCKHGM